MGKSLAENDFYECRVVITISFDSQFDASYMVFLLSQEQDQEVRINQSTEV